MKLFYLLCLFINVKIAPAVVPACEEDRESKACYDAIEAPLMEIGRTAVKIPVKLTLTSARNPLSTLQGALKLIQDGGKSSFSIFVEALSTLSSGMGDVASRNDPGAASSELVMFAAQAVRLLVTSENITDNPLLKQSISAVSPDLLHINRQALIVVNRVGGPRRPFYLPVLYLSDLGLNFLKYCESTEERPVNCDVMHESISKALDAVQGMTVLMRTFGRSINDFMTDEG